MAGGVRVTPGRPEIFQPNIFLRFLKQLFILFMLILFLTLEKGQNKQYGNPS